MVEKANLENDNFPDSIRVQIFGRSISFLLLL